MTRHPSGSALLIFLGSLLTAACSDQSTTAVPVPAAPAQAVDDAPARSDPSTTIRFIELEIDGVSFRADSSSSFGIRFNGLYDNPRFSAQMSSAWIGTDTMTIVELSVLGFRPQLGAVDVGTGADDAPALRLARLPGEDTGQWLSTGGQLILEHIGLNADGTMIDRLAGRFDARFSEVDPDGQDVVETGQERAIRGLFDFRTDQTSQW